MMSQFDPLSFRANSLYFVPMNWSWCRLRVFHKTNSRTVCVCVCDTPSSSASSPSSICSRTFLFLFLCVLSVAVLQFRFQFSFGNLKCVNEQVVHRLHHNSYQITVISKSSLLGKQHHQAQAHTSCPCNLLEGYNIDTYNIQQGLSLCVGEWSANKITIRYHSVWWKDKQKRALFVSERAREWESEKEEERRLEWEGKKKIIIILHLHIVSAYETRYTNKRFHFE